MSDICNEFGVKISEVPYGFKFVDEDEQKIVDIINLVEDYRLTGSKGSFWKAYKMGCDPNKVMKDRFNWRISDDASWVHYIPLTGTGLTKAGVVRINESIRTYVYCVLGSQVLTRSPVIGQSGLSLEVQKEFLVLVEDSINNPKGIPDSITRYQDEVSKSGTRLNYVIATDLYIISDNLVMNMPSIPGYNNAITVAGKGLYMGVNDDLITTMKGQTLIKSLVKPSPTKRIPIDHNVAKPSTHSSKPSTPSTSANVTKTNAKHITTEDSAAKHGPIYNTGTSASLTDHEDMKILLIVSGITAGLGFMYFYEH